ncbi:hypothetical protein N799_09865 [Lysobacter arseniciresistens ZS79]|uniref:Uncharacterized protein n=1 Tax=Lysobacter arseniciresistens ZS79 TaxID=913325 RepID=A0A0A0EVM4_9GAMM|nr:hypothetical protein N799_09865 [Lysobacter arseniciresistens ZS79]
MDLLGFSFDSEMSFGMVGRIVEGARSTFVGCHEDFPRAILWFADEMLASILERVAVKSSEGEPIDADSLDFRRLNQLDFMHLVLMTLGKSRFTLGDEDQDVGEYDVTPARFCAAYALRMTYNATLEYMRHSEHLRTYYLMQASTAFGLMQVVEPASEASIYDAVNSSLRSEAARKSAAARYANDPKAKAMDEIYEEWERWQRRESNYRSEADFGRQMHLKHPELVNDRSIAQRAAAWRKERRNTSS